MKKDKPKLYTLQPYGQVGITPSKQDGIPRFLICTTNQPGYLLQFIRRNFTVFAFPTLA